MITNSNKIEGISRMARGHWTAKPKKLSVTGSVNLVSFAESKRAYRGRSYIFGMNKREPKAATLGRSRHTFK